MNYQVAVENNGKGYTATVMAWPNCVATGRTRTEALTRLQEDLRRRLESVEVVSLEMDAPKPPHPMLRFAGVFKDDPLFDEVMEEIAAYRREVDADEGAP